MPTQVKIDKVAELEIHFNEAANIYITDYLGLSVEQVTKLRKTLRDSGIKYVVAKNTLLRIAARNAGYDDLVQYLTGPSAIAFSKEEPNIPAKILYDAFKEYDTVNKPEVRAFYIDRQHFAGKAVERMAKLPPREILLSQLVAAVEGPIVKFVGTLDGIIRELIGTIDAIAQKQS